MFCPNCGTNVPDNAKFCPGCGTSLVSRQLQPEAPVAPPRSVESYWNNPESSATSGWSNEGEKAPSANHRAESVYSNNYKSRPDVNRAVKPRGYRATPEHGNRNILAGVGIGLVALILVIVLVVNLAGGPMVTLGRAVQKTFGKDNGTISMEISYGRETVRGEFQYDIDWKERDIMVYGTLKNSGNKVTFGIYDGYMFTEDYVIDISDELDEMFEACEDAQEQDLDELMEQLEDMLGISLEDYIDLDELPGCLKAYGKKLNSESWLKEYAGFTQEKKNGTTYYCFEPKTYDFLSGSLPLFESAFEDPDDYEDAMDSLKDAKSELNDMDVELTLGVKSGYLSEFLLEMEIDGISVSYEIELSNIGKTEIDVDELEDMLDDAK